MTATKVLAVDYSVSSSSGSSQQLLAANTGRGFLIIGNPNASNAVWVNLTGGTAAANGVGCIQLAAGQYIYFVETIMTNAITATATAGSVITCIASPG
jgi:hypothetical protein